MTDQELAQLKLELRVGRVTGRCMVGKLRPLSELPSQPVAAPAPTRRRATKADREMQEFRRRLDAAGPHADVERIHKAMMYELGYESGLNLMGVR